ncbi:PQQ-binding-like beta-propeller repeat protein [Dietzia alimentaria]|uniref:Rv3212 family protein n=1 Tax=Dietzia alimentaria TaxID=665550 RepID=UPI00029A7264|nr:PQQ-binding-like beta-propeller repeat protein [Dietzia alimentaria]
MRTQTSGSGGRARRFLGGPPERRTRRDLLTVAIITTVMAVAAAAVLLSGSAARSDFRSADVEQPVYGPAVEVPTALEPLWSHESSGTGAPLTTKGNLVTVDSDGAFVGRDAGSGEQRWSYSHAGHPCAATFYSDVLAVAFDGASGCSDVTSIDTTTQQYASTRQSAFPDQMQLTSTWRHALAFSPERMEIWRDDLVRTVEYGAVPAPQEAEMQPRTACVLGTADLTDERFAVSERCADDDSARLTLSKTVPEDNRKPEEIASAPTGADELWIIDVHDEGVLALAERRGTWAVEWFTGPTEHTVVMPIDGEPEFKPESAALSGDNEQSRWFDGRSTHAFDSKTGRYKWTINGTSGPGLSGGWSPDPEARAARDWVMVPYPGGFATVDPDNGQEISRFDATSVEGDGVTGLAQIGDILYEGRAGAVHAYKIKN